MQQCIPTADFREGGDERHKSVIVVDNLAGNHEVEGAVLRHSRNIFPPTVPHHLHSALVGLFRFIYVNPEFW